MNLGLKDKIVLITGSGGGIGRTMAQLFAGEGATIAVNDVNDGPIGQTIDIIKASGGEAFAAKGDVTDLAGVKTMVERIEKNIEARLGKNGDDLIGANAGVGVGERLHLVGL